MDARIKKIGSSPAARKIALGTLIFFVLFSVIGFFVIPPILKSILVKKLSAAMHREVSIEQVKVNPFLLSVDLKGLLVKDRERRDTFASLEELYLNF